MRWAFALSLAASAAAMAAEDPEHGLPAVPPDVGADERERLERGRYLTRMGNCAGCHTEPGGEPFAGGRRLDTEFGRFHTPNITPDEATGIGRWTDEEFWDALHHGERPDGAALYPACPYPNFTLAERDDVDALHAYLQSVPAVRNETPAHELDFPYGLRALATQWQWLYFEPGQVRAPLQAPDPQASERWQRGRYLVEGLAHCNACHRERGALGAMNEDADAPGAMLRDGYAPALTSPDEAGLQAHGIESGAAFLRSGKTEHAVMMGPMADVVFDSLRHLSEADARAMAAYLQSVPEREVAPSTRSVGLSESALEGALEDGAQIYEEHCVACHGEDGRGSNGVAALTGNPTVLQDNPANIVQVIRHGGFPASTDGNPQPHGMPPFTQFDLGELAAVATYIRRSWGNDAAPVSPIDLR
ncbi:MAG: c-type cytochrome [Halofilum sp. (in: g-proteobacteria)]